jgi:hypothetical protein
MNRGVMKITPLFCATVAASAAVTVAIRSRQRFISSCQRFSVVNNCHPQSSALYKQLSTL